MVLNFNAALDLFVTCFDFWFFESTQLDVVAEKLGTTTACAVTTVQRKIGAVRHYMLVTDTDYLEVSEHLMPQAHFDLQRALEELWPRVGSTNHCVRFSRLSAALHEVLSLKASGLGNFNCADHQHFFFEPDYKCGA